VALSRRRLLGRMLAAGALYPASKVAPSVDAMLGRIAEAETINDPARARALRALRYLNSAQAAHWRAERRFAPALALLSSGPAHRLGGSTALNPSAGDVQTLIAGFAFQESVSPDARRYRFLVYEPETGFAYETSESGFIRVGRVMSGAFVGRNIEAPTEPTRRNRAFGLAAAVAQLFVPTLQASRGPSCCGVCGGHCYNMSAYDCGSSCGTCCNLGFSSCVWCCNVDCGCLGC
jgi:hypothetical protein